MKKLFAGLLLSLATSLAGFAAPHQQVLASLAGASRDPLWANVLVSLHGNGTNGGTSFPDAKGTYAWTFYTGASTSTTQSKFNGSSMFNTGGGGIITTTHFASLGSSEWTLDGWLWVDSSTSADSEICAHRQAGSGSIFWLLRWVNSTTKLRFVMNNGSNVIDVSSTSTLAKGGWHYYRIQRRSISGTLTMEMSVDGVYGKSGTDSTASFPSPGAALILFTGDDGNGGGRLDGWQAEVRLALGVRDTGSNFTPPTSPSPDH